MALQTSGTSPIEMSVIPREARNLLSGSLLDKSGFLGHKNAIGMTR
jgi:hypothetical protein